MFDPMSPLSGAAFANCSKANCIVWYGEEKLALGAFKISCSLWSSVSTEFADKLNLGFLIYSVILEI